MTPPTPTPERGMNRSVLLEAGIFGLAAVVLLAKIARGTLIFYLHPRYTPLIITCALVLLLVAALRLRTVFTPATGPGISWGRYALFSVPLVVALLVPARPLGASVLQGTAGDPGVALSAAAPDDDNTTGWNILQLTMALSVRGEALRGKPVDLVGFVYHDPVRPLEGFFAVRYVVVCCTADGNGASIPVAWKDGTALRNDSWVRVRGTLGMTLVNGQPELAVLASAVHAIPQPADPYLYP